MQQHRLLLYTVDMKLIRNMHNQGDEHVFSVSPQAGKSNRPFVGIIILCNGRQYCVPLSSPKNKHKSMKNRIDFHKVLDSDGKLIGVLDFNNMIPVRSDVVQVVDVKAHPGDTASVKHYKELVKNQISFCQRNQDVLINKANMLYQTVIAKNVKKALADRCLDWKKLEQILDHYQPNT